MKQFLLIIFFSITFYSHFQTIKIKLYYLTVFIPNEKVYHYSEDEKKYYAVFLITEKKLQKDTLKIAVYSETLPLYFDEPKCKLTPALAKNLENLRNVKIQLNEQSIVIDTAFIEFGTETMYPEKLIYEKKKSETLLKLTFGNYTWTSGGYHRYDIYLIAKNNQLSVAKIVAFYYSAEFKSYGKEKNEVIYSKTTNKVN